MEPQNTTDAHNRELLRFTFCSIIIATFLTGLAAGHELQNIISPGGLVVGLVVLGLSAGFAFFYIISVAAQLKYEGQGHIDRFPVPVAMGQFLYDTSINIFGFYFIVLAAQWLAVHLFHNSSVWAVILTVIFGSGVIYLIALPLWILIVRVVTTMYSARAQGDQRSKMWFQNKRKRPDSKS